MEAANFEREHQARQEVQKPVEEAAESGDKRLELASAIGNQGVQQVAASPTLQRSPAAAGLLPQGQIARATRTEEEETQTPTAEQETEQAAETAPSAQEAGQAEAEAAPAAQEAEQAETESMPSGQEPEQHEEEF